MGILPMRQLSYISEVIIGFAQAPLPKYVFCETQVWPQSATAPSSAEHRGWAVFTQVGAINVAEHSRYNEPLGFGGSRCESRFARCWSPGGCSHHRAHHSSARCPSRK